MKKQSLVQILETLNATEKIELLALLKSQEEPKVDLKSIRQEVAKDSAITCPKCQSQSIVGQGQYRNRKRYMCKDCNSTFNEMSGTVMAGLKKPDKFQQSVELLIDSISIRKVAIKLGISMHTAFDWRHKVLSGLTSVASTKMEGLVECDVKQMSISQKGDKHLNRPLYKRPSDRKTKRGVSNDKISIVVSTDRKGNSQMQVAKVGRIDRDSLERTVGLLIDKDNILCSDSHPSIIAWAKEKHIEHHTFIANKQKIKDKVYHVQYVNSLDSLLERWLIKFFGISSKYLQNYLSWFVLLQKTKNAKDILVAFAKQIMLSNNAINSFNKIPQKYHELITLQY